MSGAMAQETVITLVMDGVYKKSRSGGRSPIIERTRVTSVGTRVGCGVGIAWRSAKSLSNIIGPRQSRFTGHRSCFLPGNTCIHDRSELANCV